MAPSTSEPAAMFFTDDLQADYERMKARGAEFTMPAKTAQVLLQRDR